MWIHITISLLYVFLFLLSRGLFSKSASLLTNYFPPNFFVTKKQIKFFLIGVFWCNLLGFCLTLGGSLQEDTAAKGYLKRPGEGEEDVFKELVVINGKSRKKVMVEIKKEPYDEEEIVGFLEEALETMDERILGKNKSFGRVEHPLFLLTAMPDTPVSISWDTDKPVYLDWEGNLGEDIPKEGVQIMLNGTLTVGEYLRVYERRLTVYPEKLPEDEAFLRTLRREIDKAGISKGKYQYLPDEINGKRVMWESPSDYTGIGVTTFALVIGGLLLLHGASQKKQQEKDRQRQLLLDYPGLMNKLILLMQAGASSRRAFRKIALDYRREVEEGRKSRPAYDEVLHMYYEMEQGVPEEEAYERLGSRCSLMEYRTLATLLVQNLKKGSSRFLNALRQECVQAFEERKKRALILGEEAGTKLLLPMMGMLLLVLLILMVPSFLSF